MKIIWLSANQLGYELLKEASDLGISEIIIMTLKKNAKTTMYDGIDIEKWCEFGIEVFEIEMINEEVALIEKLNPDLMVVCGWRQIIKKEVLGIPRLGVIGFHPTLLPYGRGSAPIINTILEGIKESGVTMYYLSEGLDDGDIIAQEKFSIDPIDHAQDVYMKVIKAGKVLVKQYLPLVINQSAPRRPQDSSKVYIFKKPKLQDNKIDFEKDSIDNIYAKVRALSKPYKGAYIEKNGKRLIIWRAELKEI
ncbi:MAG: formyltransferase family protein [bacterium]